MAILKFALAWIRRLPVRFTVVYGVLMLFYLAALTVLLQIFRATALAAALLWVIGTPSQVASTAIVQIGAEGLVVFGLVGGGIVGFYNLAGLIYRRTRSRPVIASIAVTTPEPGKGTRLDKFERIGIVLAGGGAKGAYQAGALRAIHEFLEENNALDKVCMVSGTSIGSWNAMFWLAGLVKPPAPDARSAHEEWWRSINLSRTVEFDTYWPLRRNHFVKATPWMETFEDTFIHNDAVKQHLGRLFAKDGGPHFYFTRSNVGRGVMEFSTNYVSLKDRKKRSMKTGFEQPMISHERYEVINGASVESSLAKMRDAVFTSMDLPPLFPYMYREQDPGHFYEDGGVVDNLPVWFATNIEQCDLVFMLPLNASFEAPVNRRSISHRLFRVMDVRQGVLERNSLKMAYLYNELAALRAAAAPAAVLGGVTVPVDLPGVEPGASAEARAMSRDHTPVSMFAICPQQPLSIDTSEFWKPDEAAEAFALMYKVTKTELDERFEELTNPNWLMMTLVSPQGGRSVLDEF
jgi:predicted acylesterase/phospholipase RssA